MSRLGLRLVKTVNKSLVFQDIARGAGKFRQKLLFKISKLDLELLFFFKDLGFARFQLRLFKVDRDSQKLAFQTTLRHCEVDHVDEAARVGGNLDELVSRCQVEPECWVVIDRLFADLDDLSGALLDQLFSQNRHEQRLNTIDFLDDQHFTEPDRQLKVGVELGVLMVQDFHVVALLFN